MWDRRTSSLKLPTNRHGLTAYGGASRLGRSPDVGRVKHVEAEGQQVHVCSEQPGFWADPGTRTTAPRESSRPPTHAAGDGTGRRAQGPGTPLREACACGKGPPPPRRTLTPPSPPAGPGCGFHGARFPSVQGRASSQ